MVSSEIENDIYLEKLEQAEAHIATDDQPTAQTDNNNVPDSQVQTTDDGENQQIWFTLADNVWLHSVTATPADTGHVFAKYQSTRSRSGIMTRCSTVCW